MLQAQVLQACSLLAVIIGDLPDCGRDLDDQGRPPFSLLVVATSDPHGCNLDHHLPSPFSWLQLLTILLVVILIFEVLLSLSWLQLPLILLVVILLVAILIVVFLLFSLGCSYY